MAAGWNRANKWITRPVVYGVLPDESSFSVSGYNNEIDETETFVRPSGGLYVFQTADTQLEVVSTSADDNSSGSGAQSIVLLYTDTSGVLYNDIIELNGLTPVQLPNLCFRVLLGNVQTVGTYGGTNSGDITIQTTAGSVEQMQIITGLGHSYNGMFYCPKGYECHIVGVFINAEVTKAVNIRIYSRSLASEDPSGGVRLVNRINNSTSTDNFILPDPVLVPEDSDLWFTAEAVGGGSSADLNISFRVLLRKK